MSKLKTLTQKELNQELFSESEIEWLKSFLFKPEGECVPPFLGWINSLFYFNENAAKADFINVDVHTQPTDENGLLVGKVLHAGTGKVNLGVFIIQQTSGEFVAFAGVFGSYYENITNDFKRLTDNEWSEIVWSSKTPARPYWTASYLTNKDGESQNDFIEIPSNFLLSKENDKSKDALQIRVYPNPVSDVLFVKSAIPVSDLKYTVFTSTGKQLIKEVIGNPGTISFANFEKGLYLVEVESGNQVIRYKIIKR